MPVADPSTPAAPPRFLVDGPRHVPLSTRTAVLTKGLGMLFGALFVAFGAPMCGSIVGEGGARTLLFETVDVPAHVWSSQPFTRSNKQRRWTEYHVTARAVVGGETITATGDFRESMMVGTEVTARVPRSRPDLAVAFTTGSEPRDLYAWMIPGGFALIGLLALGAQLRANARDLRILARGRTSTGKIVAEVPIRAKNSVTWKVTFAYPTELGEGRATVDVSDADKHRITDQKQEPLLYDPDDIHRAVILDALPDHVRVTPEGTLSAVPWKQPLLRCCWPALVLGALAFGLWNTRLFGG